MAIETVKKTVANKPKAAKTIKSRKTASQSAQKKAKVLAKVSAKASVKGSAKGSAKVPAKAVSPAVPSKPKGKSPFDAKSLAQIKDMLLKMRERLTGQISTLSDDSLKYKDDGSSEDRTDDFDREFALNLVSSEHDAIFEIDGAMRRIEEGIYGLCDSCGCSVEKVRLHALPFARMCVKCQADAEKGCTRFRPLGDTLTQGVDQSPEVVESEETTE